MSKRIESLFVVIVILIALSACKKDKENPTMTISQPTNHSEHTIGSEVQVEVIFKDDQALKSYHIHMGNEAGDNMPEFDIKFEGDITGKKYELYESFIVPTGISSIYYLHFAVTDVEGKSTSEKVMLHFM